MRSSVFGSCLRVYSVMRNTRLWQCRRGLCPADWSALCWRPIRMENRSLHVVIRFVQPHTWSCSKVGSPSTIATLKDTSMLKICCVEHSKKKIEENNKCPNLEKSDWKNKFTCLFMLDFSIATVGYETKSWHHKTNNIFSSFVDTIRGIDLSKCSALILSAHTTCHGTRWHSDFSDIPGSKCYRYPIFS